jgi:primosomal protein N' (replication factor Y)
MSQGQRMDEWKRIKNGDALIAIGTRSAVFAPFKELGLIIIDEEQEHTYKSEKTPRFHAREVAKFRAVQHNALLLLYAPNRAKARIILNS